MLIYKITNDINSKLYFGQTTKALEERIQNHYSGYRTNVDNHLYNAMRKYGWEHFHFEIIAEVYDQQTLDELEAYFIDKYDTIKNGYNMVPGGRVNPMDYGPLKEAHDAVMRSEDVRNRISASMKESYRKRGGPTPEHRAKLSASRKALYASPKGDEVRAKFRNSFKFSEEHYRAINDAKNKSVYCIDEDGNIVAEFKRVKDAAFWWFNHGYGEIKDWTYLSNTIKESSKRDKFIRGLKWIYRV